MIRRYLYVVNWYDFIDNNCEPQFIVVYYDLENIIPYYMVRNGIFEEHKIDLGECCCLLITEGVLGKKKEELVDGYFNVDEEQAKRLGKKYYKYWKKR